MAANDKKSFVLYNNYEKSFKLLSMEERGRLITAIFEYENVGEVPYEMLSPSAAMAFSFIKDSLDRDRESYAEMCEKNAENGKKGGRPRKNISAPKSDRFFEKPKKADNDNDNDNDNGNDNDNDNGNENEIENDNDTDRVGGNNASAREVFDAPTDAVHELKTITTPTTPDTPTAPTTPTTPDTHTPLSERERKELKKLGIPEKYVSAREERAVLYARERGVDAVRVLEQWWREDEWKSRGGDRDKSKSAEAGGGKNVKADAYVSMVSEKAYDVDDFFAAALEKSMQMLDGFGDDVTQEEQNST